MAGVTMTLFCTHGRVSGPNSLLDHEVIASSEYSVPCQFDQWSGDMTMHGSCGLVHDRVSWGPACKPSLCAKLESDRYWWSLVLDNGTPERPWPTTMSMRNKALWFRFQNSAYRSVATSFPSNSLLVARAGNVGSDRYPQPMLPGA